MEKVDCEDSTIRSVSGRLPGSKTPDGTGIERGCDPFDIAIISSMPKTKRHQSTESSLSRR